MSIVQLPAPDEGSDRALVAAEVRGLLAKRKIPVYKLSELMGVDESRGYWQRRISGELPLNIDDLSRLAALLNVSIVDFVVAAGSPSPSTPGMQKAPGRGGPGAQLPDMDSNHEPTHYSLAPVISLTERRDERGERESASVEGRDAVVSLLALA